MAVHPIFSLILANNLIEVISLIQSDPGAVDARNSEDDNVTPLHDSCAFNHVEITVHLLKHGADVDCRDNTDWTPLHLAAQEGHLNIVKFIHQKRRSTLYDVTKDGRTGLYIASKNGHNDIVEWILTQDNINVDAVTDRNWTSLHVAALMSHRECCETLLKHGADINAVENTGWTPLHLACNTDDLNTVLTLMNYKPQIIFDFDGFSPLHTAAQLNHDTIVETLITQFGWDVNMVSRIHILFRVD